ELGAYTQAGNITSGRSVTLRSNAQVYGSLRTHLWYTDQGAAYVEQAIREGIEVEPYEEVNIPYQFPAPPLDSWVIVNNGATADLGPGHYANIAVQGQSTLKLRAGTYYLESLKVEPGCHLNIDNSQGAVLIFIRGELSLKVTPSYISPEKFNTLFAVTDTGPVTIDANVRGTIVAPKATLNIPTGREQLGHHGALYGQHVTVHQFTDFYHRPFERDDCATADPE